MNNAGDNAAEAADAAVAEPAVAAESEARPNERLLFSGADAGAYMRRRGLTEEEMDFDCHTRTVQGFRTAGGDTATIHEAVGGDFRAFMMRRLRPDMRKMFEDPDGSQEDTMQQWRQIMDKVVGLSAPPRGNPTMTEELGRGLASSLIKLSPVEIKKMTSSGAKYPIFKDNTKFSGLGFRKTYLFDEIPFRLEEPLMKADLPGWYDVYYHDEQIDWGALEGWDVPLALWPKGENGTVEINADETGGALDGILYYDPEESESEDATMEYGDDPSWHEAHETFHRQLVQTIGKDVCFQFDEQAFALETEYKRASWFTSGSESNFGLKITPRLRDDGGRVLREGGSVTFFRVSEPMAFARGDEQHFVSLKDPSNYGTEIGTHCRRSVMTKPTEDNTRQMEIIDKMRMYRGSWMCKLCPPGMNLPEGVANIIAEYWQTAPPPFLFVEEGDLLMLARYRQRVPDPEFPDMLSETITREHLVLARPCDIDEDTIDEDD